MEAICQLCREERFSWQISQVEIKTGRMQHLKLQICLACDIRLERIILDAIKEMQK